MGAPECEVENDGGEAPVTALQGPVTVGADCSVPCGQLSCTFEPMREMVNGTAKPGAGTAAANGCPLSPSE